MSLFIIHFKSGEVRTIKPSLGLLLQQYEHQTQAVK